MEDNRCGAKTPSGAPCKRHPIKGGTRCPKHGGDSPQARSAAMVRLRDAAAREAVARHALPRDIDPATALLEEVKRAAGAVAWLWGQITQLDPEQLVWGRVRETVTVGDEETGSGRSTEHRAEVNVWWRLWTEERDRLVRVSRDTLTAGVEERRVKVAERQGLLLAEAIRGILRDLDLTPAQRALVNEVVPRHLRAVASLDRGEVEQRLTAIAEEDMELVETAFEVIYQAARDGKSLDEARAEAGRRIVLVKQPEIHSPDTPA